VDSGTMRWEIERASLVPGEIDIGKRTSTRPNMGDDTGLTRDPSYAECGGGGRRSLGATAVE